MYTIEMLPAALGDCLWIEYGASSAPSRMLIDGGTVGTIDAIRAKILSVAAREGRCRLELVVVTHVDVPPPRREETEALLRALVEPSRQEDGNVRYDVFQQLTPRTNHFTVFAIWSDVHAFGSHEAKPHTRAFREALGPMLGAPYDERLYLPL